MDRRRRHCWSRGLGTNVPKRFASRRHFFQQAIQTSGRLQKFDVGRQSPVKVHVGHKSLSMSAGCRLHCGRYLPLLRSSLGNHLQSTRWMLTAAAMTSVSVHGHSFRKSNQSRLSFGVNIGRIHQTGAPGEKKVVDHSTRFVSGGRALPNSQHENTITKWK